MFKPHQYKNILIELEIIKNRTLGKTYYNRTIWTKTTPSIS